MSDPKRPLPIDPAVRAFYLSLDEEGRHAFDERAAILEYDAGHQRKEAEAIAMNLFCPELAL